MNADAAKRQDEQFTLFKASRRLTLLNMLRERHEVSGWQLTVDQDFDVLMGQWLSGGGIYCSSVKVPQKPKPENGMKNFQTLDDDEALDVFVGKVFRATGVKPRMAEFGNEGKVSINESRSLAPRNEAEGDHDVVGHGLEHATTLREFVENAAHDSQSMLSSHQFLRRSKRPKYTSVAAGYVVRLKRGLFLK